MSKLSIAKREKEVKESFKEYKYVINNDIATMYIDAGVEVKKDFLESKAYLNIKYDDNVESFEYDIDQYEGENSDHYLLIGGTMLNRDKIAVDINEQGIYNYGVVNLTSHFKFKGGLYSTLLRKNRYESFNKVLAYGFNNKGILSFDGADVPFEGENGLIIRRDENINEMNYPFISMISTGFYSKSALVGEVSWEKAKVAFDIKLFHYDRLYRFNSNNSSLENVEIVGNRHEFVFKHRKYIIQLLVEGDSINNSLKVTLRDRKGQILYTGLSKDNLIESIFVDEI
jgi:hypothetical protein